MEKKNLTIMEQKNLTIFQKSKKGRNKFKIENLPKKEIDFTKYIPSDLLRESEIGLPELSENEVIRHYTNLAMRNYGVDNGAYPLGSCTMKYNPKVNEYIASLEAFKQIHPFQREEDIQGSLQIFYELGEMLKEIVGLEAISMQPSAGAHGELCGLLIAKKYFEINKMKNRNKVIIPDSAHGTNFASAAMAGFEVIQINSNKRGTIDLDNLKVILKSESDSIALIMITNPNTLGVFEEEILEISGAVHSTGGLLYYDGANLNAIAGIIRPGDMGFDIVHINLHKSFSAPHGGGGPGSGPVLVKDYLKDYLPVPVVEKKEDGFYFNYNLNNTIGKIKSFYGNFSVCLKAYCYLLAVGKNIRKVTEDAVLNANYLKAKLSPFFEVPYFQNCLHEFVLSAKKYKTLGGSALNIAKRMIDYGIHPPTIYFPVIVEEAMMIEPTESENIENLENIVEIFTNIVEELKSNPEIVTQAPNNTLTGRVDELKAIKEPKLKD